MKKLFMMLLAIASCACAGLAVGCMNTPTESSSSESSESGNPEVASVVYKDGEGYGFVHSGEEILVGETLEFTLDVNAFYAGYPVVSINGKSIAPDTDGVYRVTATETMEITADGLYRDVSNMQGTGAFDNAFVVTRPIDLLYIAEQVNKGVQAYVTGAYILANDIDCRGEELEIIGDLSTENSYFSGCFTCPTNPETNEMERHTISNFTINSDDTNYVGLFGTVYADLTVQSSGLFYGINLDNFTVNAAVKENSGLSSRSISAGGLIGYAVGANILLCDATNGNVNVYGDDSYFSFVGGLIGYQQAFYMAEYDIYFPSEIAYANVDVDVNILNGICLSAGGISGYLASNYHVGATAFIHNSYTTGNVNGALRSGGIAGQLAPYTSVSNCYATGSVYATCTQSLDDLLVSSTEYCYSHAGGIVGFAENDTIVNDSFFVGKVSADAASEGCASTDPFVGGGYDAANGSATSQKYIVNNCVSEVNLQDSSFFTKQLGWGAYDWLFTRGNYPTINYETPEEAVSATLTLQYVTKDTDVEIKVDEQTSSSLTYFDTSLQDNSMYAPIGNFFVTGGLETYITADNGYIAYGYFFDEACTQKVPLSYVPQKTVTLYVGFADPTPVLGMYHVITENSVEPITFTLRFDRYTGAIAAYSDGNTSQEAYFTYDGETLYIDGARLARYFDGEIVVDESASDTTVVDAYFDMYRYSYYNFTGKLVNGELHLQDGVYFTESNPLVARANVFRGEYYTADGAIYHFYGDTATKQFEIDYTEYDRYIVGSDFVILYQGNSSTTLQLSDLLTFDAYKGSWTKSATVNKTYTFDGMGGWTYIYRDYVRSGYDYEPTIVSQAKGTYQVENGALLLSNGSTVSFDENGFLSVQTNGNVETYYAEGSHVGTWVVNNVTISLMGIGNKGYGKATASYGDGETYDLVYELSETDGYVVLYWPHDVYTKDTVFGYYTYDLTLNTLLATLTDPSSMTTGYTQTNLFVVDDYYGEWISDSAMFQDVEFIFNGNGLYEYLYGYVDMEGILTLIEDGEDVELTYQLSSILTGTFIYDGVMYEMQYDEDAKSVIFSVNGVETAQLQRKDEFANKDFVDQYGVKYVFDGRSKLSTGGVVTVGDTDYQYRKVSGGWALLDGGQEVGFIEELAENARYYSLTLGGETKQLTLANEFMGEWAIGGEFALFNIGSTDLKGSINATFKGHNVTLSYYNNSVLTFRYTEDNMPIIYYAYVIKDTKLGYNVLVLSQEESLLSGNYIICTRKNDLYGQWIRNDGQFHLYFDGITSGSYSNGAATFTRGGAGKTSYSYSYQEKGVLMWSDDVLGGRTYYYKIEFLDITKDDYTASDVYVQKDELGNVIGAIRRVEVDGLYLTEATHTDENGNKTVYFFDGLGNLYAGNEIVFTYVLKAYNENNTVDMELTDKNGVTYKAVLNYANAQNITLSIGDIVTDEAQVN